MDVELVDHMGDDLSVVNAAKVSFAKTSFDMGKNEVNLINYLARGCSNKDWEKLIEEILHEYTYHQVEDVVQSVKNMATHWTPFTHTAITLRMKAPVPIRTQCFKHKVGFTENEESRRYISSKPEVYYPPVWRGSAANVKQGSAREGENDIFYMKEKPKVKKWYHFASLMTGHTTLLDDHPERVIDAYDRSVKLAVDTYMEMLESGVCAEQARFVLPQGCLVNWIWTGNLASYARFYNQRSDSHAQYESQRLAEEVSKIIAPLYPVSWKALTGVDHND